MILFCLAGFGFMVDDLILDFTCLSTEFGCFLLSGFGFKVVLLF